MPHDTSQISPAYFSTWGVDFPRRLLGRSIGAGAFATVYELRSDPRYVVKRGMNDGTRTYLEWCLYEIQRGRRMRGMPDVQWLVPASESRPWYGDKQHCSYWTCMRRYAKLREQGQTEPSDIMKLFGFHDPTRIYSLSLDAGFPKYLHKLVDYANRITNGIATDLHAANVMFDCDRGELILTDPAAGLYDPCPVYDEPHEFTLEP